jgi:hypothetical protein
MKNLANWNVGKSSQITAIGFGEKGEAKDIVKGNAL